MLEHLLMKPTFILPWILLAIGGAIWWWVGLSYSKADLGVQLWGQVLPYAQVEQQIARIKGEMRHLAREEQARRGGINGAVTCR